MEHVGNTELAWQISGASRIDGTPLSPIGTVEAFEGEIIGFRTGLYACSSLIDTLRFARGPIIQRVRVSAVETRWPDKLVVRRREALWRIDCDAILREFARACATRVNGRDLDREEARVPAHTSQWLNGDPGWWAAHDAAFAASWGNGPDSDACPSWIAARDASWYSAWALAFWSARDNKAASAGDTTWRSEMAWQSYYLENLITAKDQQ